MRPDEVEAFTTGAIGPPGQRVFYLQSQRGGIVQTFRCEKQQVAALADYLGGLLNDLPAPDDVAEAPELVEPAAPDWTVGNMGVAYDNDRDRIVIVVDELVPGEEDEEFPMPGETAKLVVTRSQVSAFIDRASVLMAGGRPPCRLCGAPMDPGGHVCPRAN